MNKIIAVILGVFLLTTPTFAKAGIFGPSYEGCVDPGDDMAGYILEKTSGTNLTKINIKYALELVPAGIEHISYGDVFKWLKTTENAAECFSRRDYLDGLKILGKHTGEFTALTTLEGASPFVAPGVFLPGTLFKWYIDILVKTLATNGFSDQVTLYIAAMEKCKEEGMTRDFCQQEIKNGNYDFALFHPTGFLVQADPPSNWRLLKKSEFDISEERSKKMFASFGSVVSSGITSKEFYDGTLTIYDSLIAKYDGTFNRMENAAYEKVIAEAKRIAKTDVNTKKSEGGFFSNLWGKIVNLFTKDNKNTQLPAQKEGTAIQPSDLSGQISNTTPDKQVAAKPTKPNPFQALYDLLERGGKLQSCIKNKLGDKFTAAYNGEYVSPEMETGWRECARSVAGQFTEDVAYIVEMPTLRQCMQNAIGSAIDLSRVLADPASMAKLEKLVSESPEIQKKMEECLRNGVASVYATFEKYVRGSKTPPAETKIPTSQQSTQLSTPAIQTPVILTYKVNCDRNLGSFPFPAVSLEWNINQSKVISQILYRNGGALVELPASGGHSYFDGTVKVGETYTYVIHINYNDGSSDSAKVEVSMPTDICVSNQ